MCIQQKEDKTRQVDVSHTATTKKNEKKERTKLVKNEQMALSSGRIARTEYEQNKK